MVASGSSAMSIAITGLSCAWDSLRCAGARRSDAISSLRHTTRRRKVGGDLVTLSEPGRLEVRVYYEDTDFSGRVYHASYLRSFERGRTEWLRTHGVSHGQLAAASETTGTAHC